MFPKVECKACYFHFSQIIFRRALKNKEAYKKLDRNDTGVWSCFRKLQALASIPPKDLLTAIEIIEKEAPLEMMDVVQHIKLNYIAGKVSVNRKGTQKYAAPTFPPAFWNHYDTIQILGNRTSNGGEWFHSRIGRNFITRPSIWAILRKLKKYAFETDAKLTQYKTACFARVTKQQRLTVENLRRLRTIQTYDIQLNEMLESLALAINTDRYWSIQCNKYFYFDEVSF